MKLNHLLVTDYLKKILITIISLSVFLTPALAFASDVSDQEQAPLEVEDAPYYAPDLDHQRIMLTAQDIKAATATEYTTTDIYNLLYAAVRGTSTSSTYSLPYIGNRLANIYNVLSNQSYGMSSIYSDLHTVMQLLAGTTTGVNPINNINDALYIITGGQSYSQAELTGMIWSLVQDLNTSSNLQVSYLSAINSSLLSSHDISWSDLGFSYVGTSLGFDTNFLSSATSSKSFKVVFRASTAPYVTPSVIRLYVPFLINNSNNITSPLSINSIKKYSNGSFTDFTTDIDYFVEHASNGTYFYIFNFWKRGNVDYYFEITSPSNLWFYNSYSPSIVYVDYDTYDYQLIKTAFYQQSASDSLASSSDAANALADYFVSPEKQAAENASEEVIDDTLDNFTGSGGAAAKKADTSSMKDISVQVKSGINGGGSTSNATDVLNPSSVSGQTFWIWFSTTTKNNVENPYPAPVVNNTRKSSYGDEIIDTLSGYQEQLKNLLGGDSK